MKQELKEEAIRRMHKLGLYDKGKNSPVVDFIENEVAWKSEAYGILYI